MQTHIEEDGRVYASVPGCHFGMVLVNEGTWLSCRKLAENKVSRSLYQATLIQATIKTPSINTCLSYH